MDALTMLALTAALVSTTNGRLAADDTHPAAEHKPPPLEAVLTSNVSRELRVRDSGGMTLDGAIASIHDGQVDVLTPGGTRTLPLDSISLVERRGDSVKDGFWAGAAVGGVMGLLMSAECGGDIGYRISAMAMSGAMYGLVGAGIDALYSGWTPLYVRKGTGGHGNAGSPRTFVRLRVRF